MAQSEEQTLLSLGDPSTFDVYSLISPSYLSGKKYYKMSAENIEKYALAPKGDGYLLKANSFLNPAQSYLEGPIHLLRSESSNTSPKYP